ncbi:MAG: NB-ARC domain protein [Gemmataceae bacterium]|nr:NB-ARC domain protein [Gemmataceae bacterium]
MCRRVFALGLIALLPAPVLAQGKKDELEPIKVVELKRKDLVSYEKEVEPIFYKRCITCHSGSVKESRFDISTYENLIKGGKRGSPIVPGKGESSLLYKSCGRTAKPFMPPKDEVPLTPDELALIKLWIEQGARAPSGPTVREKIKPGLPPLNVTPIRAVAVSPDKSAVAAGRGNQVHVYDAGSGTHVRSLFDSDLKTPDGKPVKAAHLSLVESMAFSPDGKFLATGSFQTVSLWDVQTGKLRHKLDGFAHNVVAITFSPDSKLLATGGGAPTEDGEVKVFAVGDWQQVMNIKNGHSDTVYGVSFSPDGKMLASCGADKFIKVFEVPSGKLVKSFEGHTHQVLDVGWHSGGNLLASAGADNTVKVWDFAKGEQVRTINAHTKQVTRLVFVGKSANFVTCSGDQTVKFWNVQNGGNVRNFGGNNDFVYAVGVTPDGSIVAAGGEEGIVRVYNGNNGQLVRSLQPPAAKQ